MYKSLRAWAEIDLDNLAHNYNEIKKNTNSNTKIMAIVKADAYGHGAVEISKELISYGVDRLAVAFVDEAIELRKAGIEHPIMLLGYTSTYNILDIIEYNIIPTVIDYNFAYKLSKRAVENNKSIKCHINIDTGMNRIGYKCNDNTMEQICKIDKLPGIEIEGIYSHFSSADEKDSDFTNNQYNLFSNFTKKVENKLLKKLIKHICNSAGIANYTNMHMDMVRPGIILYGYYPSIYISRAKINLKPVMTLKSRITYIKEVNQDTPVSYGRIYYTKKRTKIATVSAGYADGYTRLLSERAKVKINNVFVPVIGRITMDQCMIDISNVKNIEIDDEVVLMGGYEIEESSAEKLAQKLGTITYELVCMVGKRVDRVYIKNNKVVNIIGLNGIKNL